MLFGRGGPKPTGLSGYNFTERVRVVLARAREEAMRLQHARVDTEHLLLGLVREGQGIAATVLRNLDVDLSEIPRKIEALVPKGATTSHAGPDLPYTGPAKKVLELAMTEARELNHSYVGTEHLLLSLLREGKGVAAQVLTAAGVTLDTVRAETLRLLGSKALPSRPSPLSAPAAGSRSAFHVQIDDTSDRSIYEQIVAQVQEAVATGRLSPGDRLPTVRQLADELDIAPGTVARAYAELERLSVVVTEGARGTRVAPLKNAGIVADRSETLVGLLRPVAVAAFHLGASADELRAALERAMVDIFGGGGRRDAA